MQLRNTTLACAAAGIFVAGTAAGWSTPRLFKTFDASIPNAGAASVPTAADTATPAARAVTTAATGPAQTVPPISAPNYRAIVAQNRAAVVGISSVEEVKSSASQFNPFEGSPFGDQDPFFRFFRGIPGPQTQVPMRSEGSGFIVSPDGLIFTNAHVVNGAKNVTVTLSDHREFKAKVLGADKASDIAVLKIDAHGLPTVHLGNSDQVRVGDYVLAIGSPFGLEETATAGIVSATERSLPGGSYVPFIQTDAAVNPGNSGGPLFDASGEVVGINSQIYTNSGGYQGVAFAIPINVADQVKEQIVKTGKVEHGRLGIEVQNVDQSLAQSFNLASPNGALVAEVKPGSPAATAGLRAGDVILRFNGEPIISSGDLSARVHMALPGERANLEIWRDGQKRELTVRIESTDQSNSGGTVAKSEKASLGVEVRPLTPQERKQAGVADGLLVEEASGHAADAGIQPGDVILAVDGTPVRSASDLRNDVGHHKDHVALLIERGDTKIFVPVALG
jgi:serine protease Do